MTTHFCALIDERHVEDTLFLRRGLGMPRLLQQEPVIDPGQSFGPIIRDANGRWTMWYIVFVTRDIQKDLVGCETPQCIAYSRDGIHWEKPSPGIRSDPIYADHPNIIIASHQRDANGRDLSGYGGWSGLSILDNEQTPHPCARARYTALTTTFPSDTIGGVCLADSGDGIHWTFWPENPVIIGSPDTQNTLIWDERIGKYVCYLRPIIHCGMARHANRKMARCESEDLIHWTPSRVIIDTDEFDADAFEDFDEPGMRGARGRTKQFQGLSPFILNGCYLGFTWFYHVKEGIFVNELLHSADGIHWQREALRQPFVAEGRPDGFHGKLIVPAADAPVLVGDEYFFYASSTPHGHHEGALADIGEGSQQDRRRFLEENSIYGFAIKRDRWVGYEAQEIEGEFLSTPQEWEGGSSLCLNATIEAGGYIRVEIEDQWGRPVKDAHLDEIDLIRGSLDATDHIVTFGPGPKTIMRFPPIGPVRIRCFLKQATLYGWSYQIP